MFNSSNIDEIRYTIFHPDSILDDTCPWRAIVCIIVLQRYLDRDGKISLHKLASNREMHLSYGVRVLRNSNY